MKKIKVQHPPADGGGAACRMRGAGRIGRLIACLIAALAAAISGTVFSGRVSAEGTAKAELLLEADTGQVLYSMNGDEKLPMASITKIMPLLIWAEEIERGELTLEESVRASSYASSAEGSVIWLEAGEEMTVAELLEAVIISSANDACIALAEHTAGSEAQMVKQMNKRAKELGMTNTRYTNCVGFDEDGHYTTARDIATAMTELMKHEVYRGWMLTWLDYLRGGETQLVNTNKLIKDYDGILGGKTGTTDNAGCCLAVCAQRGDMRLIAVTLGNEEDEERFESAESLLDYGFDSFEKFTPESDPSELAPIKVIKGTQAGVEPVIENQGEECVIRKGRSADVVYEYSFVEQVEAPVEKGQFLGEYLVTLDGAEVFRSEIVAEEDVSRMTFWRCLLRIFEEIISM